MATCSTSTRWISSTFIARPQAQEGFAGADCVFHLAAQAGGPASWGSSFRMYAEDNVIATQAVLETCVAMRVPTAVYASSSSV